MNKSNNNEQGPIIGQNDETAMGHQLTGATPSLVGSVIPANANGGAYAAPPRPARLPYAGARLPWKRAYESVFDSSIMEEPYHVRLVFDYMIRKADSRGFCRGTDEALARHFNVTLSDFLDAIKVLESPDSKSRTKDNDGRRIAKVQGGYLILNHGIYQSESRTKNKTDNENENENRVSDPNRVSLTREQVSEQVSFDLSPEELSALENLTGRARKLFFILRGWASVHAGRGSSKFPVSRKFLAETLDCTGPNTTLLLQRLVELGVIKKVEEHDYGKKKSAMYRWIIETTIPIPSASEPESEDDDEPLF